jgi:hypothetical protein
MRAILPALAVGLVTLSGGFQSVSAMQAPTPVTTPSPYSYADIADLATIAPMAIHGRIYRATPLKAEQAPGLKAGQARLYIEADVVGLIRGSGPLAARINYLVDLPLDAKGKPPKLKKKQPVLIFARPVAGAAAGTSSTASVRLVAPDAQLPWDPATDTKLRAILTELVKPGAPPAITGIANGFHVPGTLPGEGETQLFLDTQTGEPVSLTILTARRRFAALGGGVRRDRRRHRRRCPRGVRWPGIGSRAGCRARCRSNKLGGTAPEDRKQGSVGLRRGPRRAG